MGFSLKNVVRELCAIALVGAVWWGVGSAPAQSTVPSGGAPAVSSGSDALGQQMPWNAPGINKHPFDSANLVRAPRSLFGADDDGGAAPMMMPQVNALQQMMQDERQKNWTEMTPEEIFGLPAPDKSTDPKISLKANASSTDVSALETYLLQKRLVQTGSTNLGAVNEGWNFLDDKAGLPDQKRLEELRNGSFAHSQIFDRLLGNAQDYRKNSLQNNNDAWNRVFVSARQSQSSQQQVADMDAFTQLIHPTEPTMDMRNAALGGKYFAPVVPPLDANLEPRPVGYNPVGGSFAPLTSGIGRPKRLDPLPGLTSGLSAPSLAPSWAPRPPPWTQDSPQVFVNPVRKW
jgi:hypothetical protein